MGKSTRVARAIVVIYDRDGQAVTLQHPSVDLGAIDSVSPPGAIMDGGNVYALDGLDAKGRVVYRQWPPRPPQ